MQMTEAEALEISSMMWSNSISLLAISITLISGYLIAAYIAGSGMTHSQAIIVNILYVGFASFLVLSMLSFMTAAGELGVIAFEMTNKRTGPPRIYLAHAVLMFVCFCVAASLKFMWDIRHPKSD